MFVSRILLSCVALSVPTLLATEKIAEKTADGVKNEAAAKKKVAAKDRPVVEVCFVLDTTGSMGGLIAGAKQKIWDIATEIAQRQDNPVVKFGLIGYRDVGDSYITKKFSLTEDLDEIHGELMKFAAGGGGDGPESVNQALNEAVVKMEWSKDKEVKKIIFLVGDAPPHMDYKQDVKYPVSCKKAVENGVIINTIQCGNMASTTPIWKDIAAKGKGMFVALPQNGGMIAIAAPQDKEIAKLTLELNATVVAYGTVKVREQAKWKQGNTEKLAQTDFYANASRAACLSTHKGAYKAFAGNNDLIAEWGDKRVTWANLKKDNLPKEWAAYDKKTFEAEIAKRLKTRSDIKVKMDALLKQRTAFISAEVKKNAGNVEKAFDQEVEGILKEQLKASK